MAPKRDPYATHKPPEAGSGLYLKVEDGKSVSFRICTEPYIFLSRFERNGEVKWSTRYSWLVYNITEDKAQVLDLSPTTYKQIAAYATDEEYGDPTGYNLKISREGVGLETEYSLIASPNKSPLTTDYMKAVRGLGDITSIKGHEHCVPLSQVEDASELKRPDEEEQDEFAGVAAKSPHRKDVVIKDLDDDEPLNLDEIPF